MFSEELVRFIVEVITVGGGAAAIAYLAFTYFGKKWLDGKYLTGQEEKKLEYIKKSADLTIAYGAKAAFVIAGRGVGPATAFRILSKANITEEELLKNILHEERLYIQNKKFWTD